MLAAATRAAFGSSSLRLPSATARGAALAIQRQKAANAPQLAASSRLAIAPAFGATSSRTYATASKKGKSKRADKEESSPESTPQDQSTSPSPPPSSSSPEAAQPTSADQPSPAESTTASSPAQDSTSSTAGPEADNASATARRGTSAFDIDTTLATIAEDAAASGGDGKQRTGARARSDARQTSMEKQRKTSRRLLAALAFAGIVYTLSDLAREFDTVRERRRFEGNPSAESPFGRIRLRIQAAWEDLNAPKWEKLLPDPLPYPYSRPYTLVVDLDELLVHSHWTREHGWRTAKRPGLDYFLGYLGQVYEIVLYTSQPMYIAQGILDKLDPDQRFITYRLFKESCRVHNGKTVKDLNALNRDLTKTVILDTDPEQFSLNPENGVVIKKWDGNKDDRELMKMLEFLEAITIFDVQDVRKIIKAYEGTDVATEHARRMQGRKERELQEWKASGGGAGGGRFSGLKSLFGGIRGGDASSSSGDGPPKTWYEVRRGQYQDGYAQEQKYWEENKEAFRQQAREEQEKQIKEMKLNAWSMITGGFMPGAAQRPEDQAAQQQQQKSS